MNGLRCARLAETPLTGPDAQGQGIHVPVDLRSSCLSRRTSAASRPRRIGIT